MTLVPKKKLNIKMIFPKKMWWACKTGLVSLYGLAGFTVSEPVQQKKVILNPGSHPLHTGTLFFSAGASGTGTLFKKCLSLEGEFPIGYSVMSCYIHRTGWFNIFFYCQHLAAIFAMMFSK